GCRFLDQAKDTVVIAQLEDAQVRGLGPADRHDGDGHVGVGVAVSLQQPLKVHAVKLVAGQYQDLRRSLLVDMGEVLAKGVGGALEQVGGLIGWLGGEDFAEALAEGIELVGVGEVAVQADAQELRHDIDAVQPAVMQLLIGMSMSRYLPATGTAGSLRRLVSG